MFLHAERFTRQATALAAYRLARTAGMGHDAAQPGRCRSQSSASTGDDELDERFDEATAIRTPLRAAARLFTAENPDTTKPASGGLCLWLKLQMKLFFRRVSVQNVGKLLFLFKSPRLAHTWEGCP